MTYEFDQASAGAFLRACRKERGLTTADVAAAAGVSPRAVTSWETGESQPSPAKRPLLAALFDVPFFSRVYDRYPGSPGDAP